VIGFNDGLECIKPGEQGPRKTITTTVERKETYGATETKMVYPGAQR
jgi:hypothetical protein